MAYKTSVLYKTALEKIEKHKLFFTEDVIAMLGISKDTFYNHFPKESDESYSIKKELEKNRIAVKSSLRSKWYKSENSTTQIALYKMIASEQEADRLNGSRQKIEHSGNIEIKQITGMEVK